jgi:hypothetical protein
MKSNQLRKPSAIESRLIDLGARLSHSPPDQPVHPQQAEIPEWVGADVHVTSDFAWEPKNLFDAHELLVRTRHAKPLTWLIFELRDAFEEWLDFRNKYGFYGSLAQAAQRHLAAHQPESDDPRPLLKDVLAVGFKCVEALRREGELPEDAGIIVHQQDAEGRQRRIDPETGVECL